MYIHTCTYIYICTYIQANEAQAHHYGCIVEDNNTHEVYTMNYLRYSQDIY